ncbi:MAG: arginyltransferase [Deltaproteobacteria bacterium]|nr:arginyltransferase [Deltaproteobacteria bacterium]
MSSRTSPESQTLSFYPAPPPPLELQVSTSSEHACPYLSGRIALSRGFQCRRVPGWAHQLLMDAGFRRSGKIFYQPVCPGCRACTALRVRVGSFRPGKSLRRIERRNRDLSLGFGVPSLTDEKHALYRRYLERRHDGKMASEREDLEAFLYRSPTETLEVCYRGPGGRLLAVGICDRTPVALSSVYFYFDPDEGPRSLGTFGSLVELRLAESLGLAYYYPGFWIEGCRKMSYKTRLRPCELLGTDAVWRPFEELGEAAELARGPLTLRGSGQ